MPSFGYEILIDDDFKYLLDKDVNESLVLSIINKSRYVFKNQVEFKWNISQSNGESDYSSNSDKFNLDLKLFIPQDFCQKLNIGRGLDLENVGNLSSLLNEGNMQLLNFESGYVKDKRLEKYLQHYKSILLRELKKYHVIVFHPFPITKFKGSFMNMFNGTMDGWLNSVQDEAKSEFNLYFLAPTFGNEFYLANIKDSMQLEFINFDEYFQKYAKITKIYK